MKLQRLKVADLSGDPANARKHDERNIGLRAILTTKKLAYVALR